MQVFPFLPRVGETIGRRAADRDKPAMGHVPGRAKGQEPVLAELTTWVAKSGEGKTGVPRPAGLPKALNAKAVWFALALGADPKPDAASREGLNLLLKTVKSDQTENGSWAAWPETRP